MQHLKSHPTAIEHFRGRIAELLSEVFSRDELGDLRQGILGLLERHGGGVSLAEICALPGARGTHDLAADGNVILWSAMSLDAISALIELRTEGQIRFAETHPLVYVADGERLRLPLATAKGAQRGYARARWMPVTVERGANWNPSSAASSQ